MTERKALIGVAVLALGLAGAAGAANFNLPDAAISSAPGSTVTTNLRVFNGADVAAINVNIRYNKNVVTPNTAGIVFDAAGETALTGAGWNIRSNVLNDVAANTNELRIVVYASPTNTFDDNNNNNVVVQIPWGLGPGAAPGQSTVLDFVSQGVSNALGQSAGTGGFPSASFVDGQISIVTFPTRAPQAYSDNYSGWGEFNVASNPLDQNPPSSFPGRERSDTALSLVTTADNAQTGGRGYHSGANTIDYAPNTLYLAEWTINNTVVPGFGAMTFRMRFQEEVNNAFTELAVAGVSQAFTPGTPTVYPQFFLPSDLTASVAADPGNTRFSDLYLAFDAFEFETAVASTVTLSNVDISSYDINQVNAAAIQLPGAGGDPDLTQASQWLRPSYLNIDGDPQGEFELPSQLYAEGPAVKQVEELPTYSVLDANRVRAGSPFAASASNSIGYFNEFGIPAGNITNNGAIYRQTVRAQTEDGSNPLTTPTIRLRLTDQLGAYSSSYQIENAAVRQPNPIFSDEASFASNRPPLASSGNFASYQNFLAFPESTNIAAYQNPSAPIPNSAILALVGVIDFDENAGGNTIFSDVSTQSIAPEALLP